MSHKLHVFLPMPVTHPSSPVVAGTHRGVAQAEAAPAVRDVRQAVRAQVRARHARQAGAPGAQGPPVRPLQVRKKGKREGAKFCLSLSEEWGKTVCLAFY